MRGGWGITSNQGVAPYSTLGLLNTSTYNFGQATPGEVSTYLVSSLANTHLHWEQTAQTNLGLDFGFLRNRITGTLDLYEQKTKDILLQETLPASNGASSVTTNLGKSTGKGIEINLSSINIKTARWIYLEYGYKFLPEQGEDHGPGARSDVGYSGRVVCRTAPDGDLRRKKDRDLADGGFP